MRGKGQGSQRGDGRWSTRVTVQLPGGRRKSKDIYGATQKEMQENAAEFKKNALQEITGDMSLKELRTRWLEVFGEGRKKATRTADNTAWKRCEDLHSLSIQQLRRSMLSDYLNDIYKDHSRTAEQVKSHLSQLLAYAVDREWLEANPLKEIVWRHKRKKTTYKKLSRSEVSRIIGHDSIHRDFWWLLAETGLRPWLEGIALETSDVFQAGASWWVLVRDSKTDAGENRVVPISNELASVLRTGEGPLFLHAGKRLTKTTASEEWGRLLDELGIPHTRVYELRHYANVQLQLSDAPEIVKRWYMGHTKGELALSTYGKSSPENMVEVIESLSKSQSK